MKKILFVFGTRPEAIKMAPLILKAKKELEIDFKVCVTGQHREMLDQVLNIFDIKPDYDLNIMKENQNLYDVTSKILLGMKDVFNHFEPDIVLVHGDTTTTMTVALAAFYEKIKVGHIEAGLRTNDKYSPWPEEMNRHLTSVLADFHFAPTLLAKENLLKENKSDANIIVTGNTVVDALLVVLEKITNDLELKERIISEINTQYTIKENKKFILVTGHRRENFGQGFIDICEAIKTIAKSNQDIDIVFSVHLNPNVQKPVRKILSKIKNIYLIKPLDYIHFVYMMNKSFLIITDSGGIQEEAPTLGKPVLVTRTSTERIESLENKTIKLVGTNKQIIIDTTQMLIDDISKYHQMSNKINPYGNGTASQKILEFIKEHHF